MSAIDGKYKILATNPCKLGSVHTEEDGCFFCVHDVLLPDLLDRYVQGLKNIGAGVAQIHGAEAMARRVVVWQEDHPDQVKTPDVSNGCELDHVMNPDG